MKLKGAGIFLGATAASTAIAMGLDMAVGGTTAYIVGKRAGRAAAKAEIARARAQAKGPMFKPRAASAHMQPMRPVHAMNVGPKGGRYYTLPNGSKKYVGR
jgi:hypothetical protein